MSRFQISPFNLPPNGSRNVTDVVSFEARLGQLEAEISSLRDIVEAHEAANNSKELRGTANDQELEERICEVRSLWPRLIGADRRLRIALAVLHGLAERSAALNLNERHLDFFGRNFGLLRAGTADAAAIENEATILCLPVMDATQRVVDMKAWFGYVEEIDDAGSTQLAQVVLHDENDLDVVVNETLPAIMLPEAFRHDGAGVAWVERHYRIGNLGRFEPASAGA